MSEMTASSTSTFIELSKAASSSQTQSSASDTDAEVVSQAAKVLTAVNGGANVVAELKEKTGLETNEVVSILAGLSRAGLVVLEDDNGTLRAALTEATKVALST
jgi:hypothetical protein